MFIIFLSPWSAFNRQAFDTILAHSHKTYKTYAIMKRLLFIVLHYIKRSLFDAAYI